MSTKLFRQRVSLGPFWDKGISSTIIALNIGGDSERDTGSHLLSDVLVFSRSHSFQNLSPFDRVMIRILLDSSMAQKRYPKMLSKMSKAPVRLSTNESRKGRRFQDSISSSGRLGHSTESFVCLAIFSINSCLVAPYESCSVTPTMLSHAV